MKKRTEQIIKYFHRRSFNLAFNDENGNYNLTGMKNRRNAILPMKKELIIVNQSLKYLFYLIIWKQMKMFILVALICLKCFQMS